MRLVVNSSVLVALLLNEPERERFHLILLANEPVMSVANLAETYSVARARLGADAIDLIDLYIATYEIEVAPVAADAAVGLRHALLAFGKGRGEDPAVLSFGDLFAYALARRLGLPLLFKGDDFARTDVQRVPA
jgi:ribonuclease VapC